MTHRPNWFDSSLKKCKPRQLCSVQTPRQFLVLERVHPKISPARLLSCVLSPRTGCFKPFSMSAGQTPLPYQTEPDGNPSEHFLQAVVCKPSPVRSRRYHELRCQAGKSNSARLQTSGHPNRSSREKRQGVIRHRHFPDHLLRNESHTVSGKTEYGNGQREQAECPAKRP